MYEFNGWVVLRYHTHDTQQELQEESIKGFINYIQEIDTENVTLLKRRNGLDSFLISGLHNHYVSYVTDIYKWIAINLPGSYGLLHVHNDEDITDEEDNSNHFIVWKLARGRLLRMEDYYLSPYIPTVEDEYDPSRND